jgi:putative nucleotidyltransferase with HDIG domain
MTAAVTFLQCLARAVTAMNLYEPDHPSARHAIDRAFTCAHEVSADAPATFTFLGDEVIWGKTPLRPLRGWAWASRLDSRGLQRLEIDHGLGRTELREFLEALAVRLGAGPGEQQPYPPLVLPHIRIGAVTVACDTPADTPSPGGPIALTDEITLVEWVLDDAAARGVVSAPETHGAASALSILMHAEGRLVLPLCHPAQTRHPLAAHAISVAVLSMGLAEALGCSGAEARELGAAGLLHDIGKVRLPLLGPEPANAAADGLPQARPDTHCVDGARMILRSSASLQRAAVVAYEHHLSPDGTGVPAARARRPPHWTAQLVAVCNTFDHLRLDAAPGDDREAALEQLDALAGARLDASLVQTFTHMVRRSDRRDIVTGPAAPAV